MAQCGEWNKPLIPFIQDSIDKFTSIKEIKVTRYTDSDTFFTGDEPPSEWKGSEISGIDGKNDFRSLGPSEYTVRPATLSEAGTEAV
jgi:hypothetical protein